MGAPRFLSADDVAKLPGADAEPKTLTAAEVEKLGAPKNEGWFSNKPGPAGDDPDGGLKNIATGVEKGLHGLLGGMVGDAVEGALGVGASAVEKYEKGKKWLGLSEGEEPRSRQKIEAQWRHGLAQRGKEVATDLQAQIDALGPPDKDDFQKARKRKELTAHLGRVVANVENRPPTTEEIFQKTRSIMPTGEYMPETAAGHYLRAGVQGATQAATTPGPLGFGRAARTGAVAGVAGQGAQHAGVEDPLYALPTAIVAPWLFDKAMTKGRHFAVGPNADERYVQAGKVLLKNTRDAEAALAAARERAGLPAETLAEATLDQGHARTQDIMQTRGNPDVIQAVENLRNARNEQLMHRLQGAAMDADPKDVAAGVRAHRDQLEREAQAAEPQVGPTMDETGAAMRETVHGKSGGLATIEKKRLDDFKKTIDPDGTLGTYTGDLSKWAKDDLARAETRQSQARGAVADELIKEAAGFKPLESFQRLDDFVQKINEKLAEVKEGSTDFRALMDLKTAAKKAQNEAVANQHKLEALAVKAGKMNENETLAAKLQQEVDAWKKGKGAPEYGEQNLQPIDPETVAKQQQFNTEWGVYKDTFKKGVVGAAEEKVGRTNQLNAQVAENAFKPGSSGFETANMWINAAGEKGVQALKDIATNRLHKELNSGRNPTPLDDASLGAWKTKHADALRAIDEYEVANGRPKFSEQFDNAAGMRRRVQAFEDGSAKRFLGLTEADDIVNNVGKLMTSTDSAKMLSDLMEQAKKLPNADAAIAGIRRAGAQWLENYVKEQGSSVPSPTSELGTAPVFSSPKVKKFFAERGDTLKLIFEPEAIANVQKIIEQNERSIAVRTIGKSTHGAQTAERLAGEKLLNAQMDAAVGIDVKNGGLTTGALLGSNLWLRAGEHLVQGQVFKAGGYATLAVARSALEKAFVNRGLNAQIDIANILGKAMADRQVGAALLQSAVDQYGRPNMVAFDALAKALQRSVIAAEAEQTADQQRQPRAAGGRAKYKFDCASRASKLCREAELIRKRHAGGTKQLLNVSDDEIADALRVAGGRI